jgi:hypothetical protein
MNHVPNEAGAMRDPVARVFSAAALLVALMALVFSMGESVPAQQDGKQRALKAKKTQSAKRQRQRNRRLNTRIKNLRASCPIPNAVDFGTWCLESAPYTVPPEDRGKNNYLYATQACVQEGGWLPTAAQLLGAAPRAKLESTIDDNHVTSGVEEFPDPQYGIKDEREMSADLFTVSAGSAAAGSHGVTAGSRGNKSLGEPDPVPFPADPLPETLNYVTVYDNHDIGGFAGGAPVGAAETFRCAYAKGHQGAKFDE